MFLPEAISSAYRQKDWIKFEEWVQLYRLLPAAFRRDHSECAIWNLQGLRALDEGREEDALAAMAEVVELATSLEYLSNSEVSALPRRLYESGKAPTLTARFMELTKERDWRIAMDEFHANHGAEIGNDEADE